jgi:hypothetical protein
MSMDDSTRGIDDQDGIDEEELKRRYSERLSDWSDEPMKINRNGKLLDPLVELRKRIFKLPWDRPKR